MTSACSLPGFKNPRPPPAGSIHAKSHRNKFPTSCFSKQSPLSDEARFARNWAKQHNREESNWSAVTRLVLATKLVLSYGRSGTDQEVCHQQLTDLARLISRTVVRSPSSMGESIPNLSW